jgi:hypothetical protein
MRFSSTRVLAVLPLLLASYAHADQIALKPSLQVGQAWTFDNTQDSTTDNKATKDGQTQPFTSKTHSHHSGKAEVLAVQNGLPSSMRITFDADSSDSSSFADQPAQSVPFVYAGKAITITRGDDGSVTDDFTGQADPNASGELHSMLDEQAVFFPKQPVSVGDEWQGDPQALSRALQLAGNDRAGMTLKLLSVKDVGGRSIAEIKVSVVAQKAQGTLQSEVILQGTSLVDLQSGHAVKSDLAGTIKLNGQQTSNDPNGNAVTYQVEGSGTLTSSGTADFLNTGAPAAAGGPSAVDGGAAAPAAVNPLAPTPSFTGKFAGDSLSLDGSDSNGAYQGSLQLGENKFPAKATVNGPSLTGTFDAGGSSFSFTATMDGDSVTLNSGGKTYRLKRSVPAPVNPLDPGGTP